jgi:ATP-binding cassette subfamily B protein
MPPEPPQPDAHARPRGLPLASLWRIRSYLRPYLGRLAFMLFAACTSVGAQICVPLLTKSIIDHAIALGHREELVLLALAATGLGASQALLNFLRRWVQASAVTGMEQAMRDDIYAHLQRLEPAFHDEWQSGQLLSRATTDLAAIRRFAGFGTIFLITNVVAFSAVIALLINLDFQLGLLTGIVLLPVAALSTWFERRYGVLSRLAQDQQGDLATAVEEAATGIGVLKALGRRDAVARAHRRQAREVYQTQLGKARLRGAFWASLDLAPNVVIGLLLLFGAIAAAHHQLSLGGLVAFITLTLQLVWPIESMGYILAGAQEAATAAQRIYEILDAEPAIGTSGPEVSTSEPAINRPGRRPRSPAGLAFEGVGFRFPGARTDLLRGIWLEVEPGRTLALTGANGVGKSTLLSLVPRLADPTAGRVLLDGTDVRDLPLAELRSRVACAFEEPTLFSASVRENVSFGMPGADDTDIARALEIAQAGFVYDLPWGLDTRIGERGMSLSGGQRQRVALARAIVGRPPLLVLDDPLSALDVQTEQEVTSALRQVLAGTTALIVAHRPSTVALADRVALLAGGRIAAVGTHSELLATEPGYAKLMSGDPRPDRPSEPSEPPEVAGDHCGRAVPR